MWISKFVRRRLQIIDTKKDISIRIHWLRWQAAGYAFITARILQFLDQWHYIRKRCAYAVNVWQQFSVQILGEYSDLYLKTDVLLANIFENFRDKCIENYGFDSAYYYTLLGFMERYAETYTRKFWIAHWHRYGDVYRAWYTRRSMFQ